MLRKLIRSKSRQPPTIADAMMLKKRLVFTCKTCKTATSKEPNDLFFKPSMELTALEALTPGPECGAANVTGQPLQVLLTIED